MTAAELTAAQAMYRALKMMPCTCVTKGMVWPFTGHEIKPKICQRCEAMTKGEAVGVGK